ncbi:hypothetical protein BT69DRAFT_946031 [Atractiella rhizophila]|nr:hypothetical protein BT69DRAFT_946031 [Atractiella rhizophila]
MDTSHALNSTSTIGTSTPAASTTIRALSVEEPIQPNNAHPSKLGAAAPLPPHPERILPSPPLTLSSKDFVRAKELVTPLNTPVWINGLTVSGFLDQFQDVFFTLAHSFKWTDSTPPFLLFQNRCRHVLE